MSIDEIHSPSAPTRPHPLSHTHEHSQVSHVSMDSCLYGCCNDTCNVQHRQIAWTHTRQEPRCIHTLSTKACINVSNASEPHLFLQATTQSKSPACDLPKIWLICALQEAFGSHAELIKNVLQGYAVWRYAMRICFLLLSRTTRLAWLESSISSVVREKCHT